MMPVLERPILSVDVAMLRLRGKGLAVLLHRRESEPFAGAWALPGVAVRADETLREAAARALATKAGLTQDLARGLHLEQLATFDALFRDPRGRTVSVAYLGLTRTDLGHGSKTGGGPAAWRRVSDLVDGALPFDHQRILGTAIERLRGKLRYTNIAARLLPETFRIEPLQRIYEAVLGRSLNRANFRSKLLRLGMIEQAGVLSDAVGHKGGRPPCVYRFVEPQVRALDRDFL